MILSETFCFLSKLTHSSFNLVGSLVPTSRATARAMIDEAVRQQGPRVILEVGPGIGPITAELVKHLRPQDRLVLCETRADGCAALEMRFSSQPELQRVRHQVEIVSGNLESLPGQACYDFIVSSIPLQGTSLEQMQLIFDAFRRLLRPGGTLSFLEYAFLRELRRLNGGGSAGQSDGLLRNLTDRFQFRKERILLNLPPTNVRSLRFANADPAVTATMSERKDFRRVGVPGTDIGFNVEAADLVGFFGLATMVLAKKRSPWGLLSAALGAGVAWFHRDPRRAICVDSALAYAASDGSVMKVDTVRHPRLGDQEWVRIATFLSPTDVHINRSPVGGRVIDHWDEPGGFLPAYQDESELNASRFIVLEGVRGKVAVAQRAGFLARRILSWPKKGELLTQGERYGLIRFGSRTDILFPLEQVEVVVRPGDRLFAGQTTVARYREGQPQG